MKNRIDELAKYYTPIGICDRCSKWLFFVSAFLSIVILYPDLTTDLLIGNSIKIAFIVSVIIHSVLVNFNGFYLIPRAENLRRKQLLSDSLGVPLTPEQTNLYYNNQISPSVLKLGVNVMENSFFAKNVCGEMAKSERIKILTYFILWIIAIFNRSTDLGLLLTLTQVLFSSEIAIQWMKVELLRLKNEITYDKLYTLFLNRGSCEDKNMIAGILDSFAFYEASKASASIKQSTKIFEKLNPRLTKEWEQTRAQLQL